MIYTNDDFINILWDNGEYIFSLSGEISESEIMDIYYSVKQELIVHGVIQYTIFMQ